MVIAAQRHGRMIDRMQNAPAIENANVRFRFIAVVFPKVAVAVEAMKQRVLSGPRMQKNRTLINPYVSPVM